MSSTHPHREAGVGEHHLARLAEQAYERRGDYPALLYDGTWLSSAEIFDRAARLGGGFASLGMKTGERVVVTMANCPEVSIVYQGLWRAGLVVTPATFLLPALELRHVVADSEASAVVTTPEFLPKVTEAVEGLPMTERAINPFDDEITVN